MTTQEKNQIIEWLYVNDGAFKNKNEWRKEFVGLLDRLEVVKFDVTSPKNPMILTTNYDRNNNQF